MKNKLKAINSSNGKMQNFESNNLELPKPKTIPVKTIAQLMGMSHQAAKMYLESFENETKSENSETA